jgi:Na+/melibiose symporter-like transporter
VPVLIGPLSDRVGTRIGRRVPFLLAATPIAVIVLVLMPFAGALAALAPLVVLFFAAYFVYYPPYRASILVLRRLRRLGSAAEEGSAS